MSANEMNVRETFNKADIMFSESYQAVQDDYSNLIKFHIFKALIFCIFIPIDYTLAHGQPGPITVAMAVALFTSLLAAFFYYLPIKYIFRQIHYFLQISRDLVHSTDQPILDYSSLANCTSTTVFSMLSQMPAEAFTAELRKVYISIGKNEINKQLERRFVWLDKGTILIKFIGFSSMIVSIVCISAFDSNPAEKSVIISYIVFQAISILFVIVVCVLLVLSPLILFALCFYYCFCFKNQGQGIGVDASKATKADIINAGGDCPICFLSFKEAESIYVLPCSNKHVFHKICLDGWASIKDTCPTCRKQFPVKAIDLEQ